MIVGGWSPAKAVFPIPVWYYKFGSMSVGSVTFSLSIRGKKGGMGGVQAVIAYTYHVEIYDFMVYDIAVFLFASSWLLVTAKRVVYALRHWGDLGGRGTPAQVGIS